MADWFTIFAVLGPLLGVFVPLIIHLNNRMDKKFEILMARMDANQRESNAKFDVITTKFDSVNTRFNTIENRLTSMESEIKNTNQRIDNTNQRIDGTNQRISEFKTDINQRLSTIEGYLVPKKIFHFEEPHHGPDEPKEN